MRGNSSEAEPVEPGGSNPAGGFADPKYGLIWIVAADGTDLGPALVELPQGEGEITK
jgi:hypothetical protein